MRTIILIMQWLHGKRNAYRICCRATRTLLLPMISWVGRESHQAGVLAPDLKRLLGLLQPSVHAEGRVMRNRDKVGLVISSDSLAH
mmetsp:Transcript_78409/g.196924  ORF Transcript_78409/g.196924 Transcript_78409/m.196924 type:complete len:86 (+) Transcript_78409:212-469(+)